MDEAVSQKNPDENCRSFLKNKVSATICSDPVKDTCCLTQAHHSQTQKVADNAI